MERCRISPLGIVTDDITQLQEARYHCLKGRDLDTSLLAAMLNPQSESLELEALAGEYGVDVHGSRTALGDSLVTAEIYCRMLPRLVER